MTAKSLIDNTLAQLTSSSQGYAVLDLDVALFCSQSKAGDVEKTAAVDYLVEVFMAGVDDEEGEKKEIVEERKSYMAGILLLDLLRFRKVKETDHHFNQIGVGIQQYEQ